VFFFTFNFVEIHLQFQSREGRMLGAKMKIESLQNVFTIVGSHLLKTPMEIFDAK
jgi:hypothetical protein